MCVGRDRQSEKDRQRQTEGEEGCIGRHIRNDPLSGCKRAESPADGRFYPFLPGPFISPRRRRCRLSTGGRQPRLDSQSSDPEGGRREERGGVESLASVDLGTATILTLVSFHRDINPSTV